MTEIFTRGYTIVTLSSLIKAILILVFINGCFLSIKAQDCAITSELTIVAQGSSNVILNVEGLINEDLATNQALCGVRLVFKHDLIGNVRMTLVSPSGQRVGLVGPGRLNSNPSQFVSWNVAFVPCNVPPSPDAGIDGVWDNEEPWAAFTTYAGVYHPFEGCLEDFNTGSANGSWLLEIENLGDVDGILQFFQLIFCDPLGSNCSECFLYAGNFTFTTPGGIYTFCEGDPLANQSGFKLDQDSITSDNQAYTFVYSKNDTILKFSDSPNEIADLSPGFYTLCGLAYQESIADTIFKQELQSRLDTLINERQICADLTEDCITLRILEIENIVTIDTLFCDGDTLSLFGEMIANNIDTSILIYDPFDDVCDSLIYLNAQKVELKAEIDETSEIVHCGQSIFLNGTGSQVNIGTITNYNWRTDNGELINALGPIAEISSGGTYFLEVISTGCTSLDSIEILQVDTFDVEYLVDIPLCYVDSFHINTTSQPELLSYTFNGPSIVNIIGPNDFYTNIAGTYEVISEFGTCQQADTITFNHQSIELTLDISASVINCNSIDAEVVINTNANIDSIIFNGPTQIVSYEDFILLSEAGIYDVTVIDDLGCSVMETIEVLDESESPEVFIQDIGKICSDENPVLNFNVLTTYDSVIWSGPNGFESLELNPMAVDSGKYFVTVYGTNGCNHTDSLLFTILNEEFNIEVLKDDITCLQPEIEVCVLNDDIAFFEWQHLGVPLSNDSCIMISNGGDYQIKVTDRTGCQALQDIVINDLREEVNLSLNTSNTFITCTDSISILSIEGLSANNDFEIIWEVDNALILNVDSIEVNDGAFVKVTVTDTISRCTFSDNVLIEKLSNPLENFDFQIEQPQCEEDQGELNILSSTDVSDLDVFINGNPIFDFQNHYKLVSGEYTLELQDVNGCVSDSTFVVDEGRKINLELGEDITTVYGNTIVLDATVDVNESEIDVYTWNIGDSLSCTECLNPFFKAFENEQVFLEIIDIFGCADSDTIQIYLSNEVNYFVPNVFSPNDDGDNDDLTLYLADGILEVFDFRIFDRWGNLVLFRAELVQDKSILIWDGLIEGIKAEQGVYTYVAKLLLSNGKETIIAGDITLIR